nr:MAG TPA: hypothetical protein [Caudoviricetes sp.]
MPATARPARRPSIPTTTSTGPPGSQPSPAITWTSGASRPLCDGCAAS